MRHAKAWVKTTHMARSKCDTSAQVVCTLLTASWTTVDTGAQLATLRWRLARIHVAAKVRHARLWPAGNATPVLCTQLAFDASINASRRIQRQADAAAAPTTEVHTYWQATPWHFGRTAPCCAVLRCAAHLRVIAVVGQDLLCHGHGRLHLHGSQSHKQQLHQAVAATDNGTFIVQTRTDKQLPAASLAHAIFPSACGDCCTHDAATSVCAALRRMSCIAPCCPSGHSNRRHLNAWATTSGRTGSTQHGASATAVAAPAAAALLLGLPACCQLLYSCRFSCSIALLFLYQLHP